MTDFLISNKCSGLYQLQLKPEAGCLGQVIIDYSTNIQEFFNGSIYDAKERSLPPIWRIINLLTGKVVYSECPDCPKGGCEHCEGACDCLGGKGAITYEMEMACEKSCTCKCDKCEGYFKKELPEPSKLSHHNK
jgi:hypothetical protein